jgi:hypothetical protein
MLLTCMRKVTLAVLRTYFAHIRGDWSEQTKRRNASVILPNIYGDWGTEYT